MPIADEQPHTVTRYAEDEWSRQPPPRRRPRWLGGVAIFGILAVLVGALVYAGRGGSSSGHSAGVRAAPVSGAAMPTAIEQAVPVGYPHTQDGAAAAAANYAIVYGSAGMYTPDTRHALIHLIADPESEASLQARLDSAFDAARSGYGLDALGTAPAGQTFVARAFVVGTSVDSYADDTAVVNVWTSSLVGLAGTGAAKPVSQIWSTLRVTLRWAADDWKWASALVTPGPAPVTGSQVPSDPGELARAAQQYQNGIWGPPHAR